jgi:plastocyanin
MTVGPYRIAPGQRFVQRFEGPGTFELICSIHGERGLRIVVTR